MKEINSHYSKKKVHIMPHSFDCPAFIVYFPMHTPLFLHFTDMPSPQDSKQKYFAGLKASGRTASRSKGQLAVQNPANRKSQNHGADPLPAHGMHPVSPLILPLPLPLDPSTTSDFCSHHLHHHHHPQREGESCCGVGFPIPMSSKAHTTLASAYLQQLRADQQDTEDRDIKAEEAENADVGENENEGETRFELETDELMTLTKAENTETPESSCTHTAVKDESSTMAPLESEDGEGECAADNNAATSDQALPCEEVHSCEPSTEALSSSTSSTSSASPAGHTSSAVVQTGEEAVSLVVKTSSKQPLTTDTASQPTCLKALQAFKQPLHR
jgi:hypothetical protein